MNQNKLSFESENLVVDWIGFNIQGCGNIEPIANYLFKNLGINSTIAKGSDGEEKTLFYNDSNHFKVSFRQYNYEPESKSFWVGTKMNFSGKNAKYFYSFIVKRQFDWNIFDLRFTSLSRIDLCYFKLIEGTNQKYSLEFFLNDSQFKTTKRYKYNVVSYNRRLQGSILKVGSRKSANYYRIYQTKSGLRFELEIKKKPLQMASKFLFSNNIEEFEEKLTKHFYAYSKKNLTLHDYYTDWLIRFYRKTDKPLNSLVTSYLKKQDHISLSQLYEFFMLLQFLSFSRNQKYTSKSIYSKDYYLIRFKLSDFMTFSGIKNKNQYQRRKCMIFFYNLQNIEPWVSRFSDLYFQRLILFPSLEIFKEGNLWIIRIAIVKQLYHYCYPFSFPSNFLTYKDTYDLRVKLKIIEIISSNTLQKVFYADMFLKQFNVPTKKKRQIKQLIVEVFNGLQKQKLIQNKVSVVKKSGEIKRVNSLTSLLVGQAEKIYFYENI